jgi:thiol peroxidase
MLSDYRDLDFARNWGLLIQELGLLAHAVYVVDRTDTVTYREVVSELLDEPNYQAAIEALQAIA